MNDKQMTMLSAKISRINVVKKKIIKRLPHSFYFLKVKCIKINPSVSFLCYSFGETIFKMKINTHVTKYMDTLTFNFLHPINPKWSIMPL